MTRIIDCHVHCFPTEQQGRDFMGRVVRRPEAEIVGSTAQLFESIKRSGVDHTNILMYTPASIYYADAKDAGASEEEARKIAVQHVVKNNDWCAEFVRSTPNLSFFCGVDPVHMTAEEMLHGVERWTAAGAKGVKFVPASLRIYGDDPRFLPLFDYCHQQDLPILTQSGGPPGPNGLAYAHPEPFGRVLAQFPKLRLIFAHMADFPYLQDRGVDALAKVTSAYPNVCADVSLRLNPIVSGEDTVERIMNAIRTLGKENVLFGSNFPLADTAEAVRVFQDLPLESSEFDAIAGGNFQRLTA